MLVAVAQGISRQDLDVVSKLLLKLGGYAEGFFSYHDFGFDKAIFRTQLDGVYASLREVRENLGASLAPVSRSYIPEAAFWEDAGEAWNYMQALRFAVGVTLSSQKYGKWMAPADQQRSMMAKIFHNCLMGILDDLIDRGQYSYLEAKDLHHLVLSSMIDPEFDSSAYMKRLITMLKHNQVELFGLINDLTRAFNRLWTESPNRTKYFYHMEMLDQRVALAEALTIFQKEPHLGVDNVRQIAETFYAPSPDMPYWARMAAHISTATRYNLIDMAFAQPIFEIDRLVNFVNGWYYFDAAITMLDHVSSIYKDLRGGIANLSLIAMRESELVGRSSLSGFNPQLTAAEYELHIRSIAALTSQGLRLVVKDFEDRELYYPFLALMMPVVLLSDWIGNRDDMIDTYVEAIAPAIRDVVQMCGNGADAVEHEAVATVARAR